ncbi:LuxR family transcriptional regulator [Carbonactinospora thermoautotrophica]|uniref:LuxR family transcriptional regulator n=1 Tax=Carbonactinospora thermoautotrophica TaxID=1469144 RepID=A0A132N6B9_9ACTN|nr:LuxR family transcriptional regulator [Carbonactinospora thermoautotrophica]KWX05813.1 LuxR family transcriptional regulator [Carbonactinospora thermoautotrophica]
MAGAGLRQPVGNLPADVTSFVGRRREVTEVKRLLSTGRLVTLTGTGGVGKTRLALHVAADLQRAFTDGVWLVELAQLRDPALLVHTVAAALKLADLPGSGPAAVLAGQLKGKQLLLVLDNCEHLLDACAVLAETLLRAVPGLRILATSRQTLGVTGEHIEAVPPLSLPDPDTPLPPGAAARYEALRLFAERAAAAVPGFTITADNQTTITWICRRLDGIPLAIELAAVRLRALSPDQLLARLDDGYRLLTTGSRAAPPRQQTLRAAVEWSFDLCSPTERSLWARLSVFAGGFDLEAAEQVCAGDDLPPGAILDLVAQLVDKSILSRVEQDSQIRYELLETIRQYGYERLREQGEHTTYQRRHRDRYARLAARFMAEFFGPGQLAWFTRLRQEHANLRAALDFCLTEPGEAEVALRIAVDLRVYWHATGFLSEGRSWLDRALALAPGVTPARVRALWVDGWLTLIQSGPDHATALLEEAGRVGRRLDDRLVLADTTLASGVAAMYRGDVRLATGLLDDALARYRALDNPLGTAATLIQLPLAAALVGDADRAVALGEELQALSEAHDERWYRGHGLWSLSIAVWRQGDRPRASALAQEAIRLQRPFHDRLGIARCLEVLAWIATADGHHDRAARLLGAAQAVWQATGAPLSGFGPLAGYHDQCWDQVRRGLGERAFAAARRHGTELDLEQVVAYALEEKQPASSSPRQDRPVPLTRRERQIAQLVAEGLSREIAARLVIAPRTAEAHVQHILAKLGFHSRAQIAAWVVERRTADG